MIAATWMLIFSLGGQVDKIPLPTQMPMASLAACENAGEGAARWLPGGCNTDKGCAFASAQCISSNGDVYNLDTIAKKWGKK